VPAQTATLATPPTPVSGWITGSETPSERRIRRFGASAEPVTPKIARLRAMLRRVAAVEERRIRIAERQQDVLEAAFVAAIADLGLDPHDSRVRKVLGARLQQAIEGGTSPVAPVSVPAERVVEAEPVVLKPSGPKPVDF
jgi:hypothetical protein